MLPILIPLITALAPMAAKLIGNALGGKDGQEVAAAIEPTITQAALQATGKDSLEAARDVLLRDPNSEEAKAFIQKVNELATQVQLAQLANERANLEGARGLVKELAQLGSVSAYFTPALTLILILGFFTTVWWLFTVDVQFDERRVTVVNIVVGALIGGFTAAVNFWLGSTAGSRIKDAQIPAPALTAPQARPAPAPQAPSAPVSVVVSPAQSAPSPEPLESPPPPPETPPGTPGTSNGWRRIRPGAAAWKVTEDGVILDGEAKPGRTIGEPITVARIWRDFGPAIVRSSTANRVPLLLVVATIATESGGKAQAVLTEPDGRQSVGLMQTLMGTASDMMGRKVTVAELNDPAFSIEAGTRYIAHLGKMTGYDPVLVAAAHNAGGIYYVEDDERAKWPNEFRIRSTGNHIRRFVLYYNDAVCVEQRDGWAAQAAELAKQA